MPAIGEKIELNLQLWDAVDTKFVRAVVRDGDGVPLGASPVSVPNVGNGLYSSDVLTMPAGTTQLTASYRVYNDAGFTTPSPEHTTGIDVFNVQPDQCIDDIKSTVNTIATNSAGSGILEGELVSDDTVLEGELVDDNTVLEGEVITEDTVVEGEIAEDDTVEGELVDDDDTIEGELVDC